VQADGFLPAPEKKNRNPTESAVVERNLPSPGRANCQPCTTLRAKPPAGSAEKVRMRFVKLIGASFGLGLCIGLLKDA
jgi:hypothetical protein